MTFITAPIQDPHIQTDSIMSYQAPLGDSLGATWDDTLEKNPTNSLASFINDRAQRGIAEQMPKQYLIQPEEANEKYKDIGLKFDRPMPASYVETLAENKRKDITRQITMARRPEGFGSAAANFSVGLAGSAIDPLNVATAFVPVMGEAKFASLAGNVGLRSARVIKGVAEGSVGAAIIEPLNYAGADANQYDYGLGDSLMNVAFGGVLGGGLHFAGGEVKDAWLARKTKMMAETGEIPAAKNLSEAIDNLAPPERMDYMRTALGQLADGQEINIKSDFNLKPTLAERNGVDDLLDIGRNNFETPAFHPGELKGQKFTGYTPITGEARELVEGVVAELNQAYKGSLNFREVDGQGGSPEISGYKGNFPEWFKSMNKSGDSLSREYVNKVAEKMYNGTPLGKKEARVAEVLYGEGQEYKIANSRELMAQLEDFGIDHENMSNQEIKSLLEELNSDAAFADEGGPTYRDSDYRPELEIADEENTIMRTAEIPEDLTAQLQELETIIQSEQAAGNITKAEQAQLDAVAAEVKDNDAASRGLLAAAMCIFRNL